MSREAARKARIHHMVHNAIFSENGTNKNDAEKKKKYRKKKRHDIEEYTENSLKDSKIGKYDSKQTTQFQKREIKKNDVKSTLENVLEESNIEQTKHFEEKRYNEKSEEITTENILVITSEKNTTELTEGITSDPSEPQGKRSDNHSFESCTENTTTELTFNNPQNDNNNVHVEAILSDSVALSGSQGKKNDDHDIEPCTKNIINNSNLENYIPEETQKHDGKRILECISKEFNLEETYDFNDKRHEDQPEKRTTEDILEQEITEKNTTVQNIDSQNDNNNNNRVEDIKADPGPPKGLGGKKSDDFDIEPGNNLEVIITEENITELIDNNPQNDNNNIHVEAILSDSVALNGSQGKKNDDHDIEPCTKNIINNSNLENYIPEETQKHDGKRILECISKEFNLEETYDFNDKRHEDQPEKRTTEDILEQEITEKNTTVQNIDSQNDNNNNNNRVEDIIADPGPPKGFGGKKSDDCDIEPGNNLEVIITEENITELMDNNLQNVRNNESDQDTLSDSIPPSVPLFDVSDFSAGSSDNYIPNDSELSDESVPRKKRRNKKNKPVNNVVVSESCSEADIPDTEAKTQRKKRKSLKERREDRLDRLLKRNAGLPYITKTGKFIERRELGTLSKCRSKCKDRIPENVREYIFDEYWRLGSYDERAKYLERLISLNKKASAKSGSKRKREYANKYKLVYFDDEHNICKGCLLKTLGETNRFLQTVNEKLKMFGRVTKSERGRAASYKKISEPRLDQVREHIKKFPAYESHYCRGKTTRKYLSPDLSVEKMYELYKSENDDAVSLTIYRSVFKKMNLSFKKPSVDTCNKCNTLHNKIKYSKSEEETESLQNDLKKHQEQYESAYENKRKDKKTAKESESTCVIAFDLQQCLPTPLLSTSVAFYKRQLWVYNLTIHDFKTNYAYCYMWPESSGGRGANQIASCLYHFIKNHLPLLHPNAKHLIMYSDSCSGQNKNSVVTTMMMILMQTSSQITTIEHKFLVPGHTHMEVDSDHALIERAKKRTSMNIHHPRDWYQLVRNASNKENKFSVIEMTHNDFYDFAEYSKKQLQVKKTNCKGEKFIWSNVQIFKYTMNQFPTFEYKERYGDDDYTSMSYAKRKKSYNEVSLDSVKKCYNEPVPIAAEKKKDIISLLQYIDPSVHDFYLNLPANGDISAAIDPDLIEEEDFYSDNF